jgi:N4-(beta-N-acetylglucosaminyl)-L-asparaginase
MKRRKFIQNASLSTFGIAVGSSIFASEIETSVASKKTLQSETSGFPMVIATWNVNDSTAEAWRQLQQGKSALDAVEKGCNIEEANAKGQSVGIGGLPDRDGNVTLDACIMNKEGNYGAVVYLQNIVHAISVARKVMEDTPHCILAGKGAEQFAYSEGFEKTNLLTEASKKAWEKWKKTSKYKPIINIENHDTIGMLAIDKNGDLSGACTTSGMAYKVAGRVGDSPIIGSGLYIDNEVGGATATGVGEEVMKTVGSFLIVELMRQGKSPFEACKEAVHRIVGKNKNYQDFQVGFLAINKQGETASYCIHPGFLYRHYDTNGQSNNSSDSYIKS